MQAGATATFDLSASAAGANDQVAVYSQLSFVNNAIHIKALGGTALDTTTPYVLFQNSTGTLGGLPAVPPVFDVAPANLNVGNWLIQPSGSSIVLLNSSASPPGGSGSITSGATLGTNIIRNTTITVSATVSGPNTVLNVYVDLSAYGGSVNSLTHGSGNSWSGTVAIPAGLPPGAFGLPILAYDGTLYGEISLLVNVLTTTDTWNGADFASNPDSDDNGNWVGGAAPGYVGDSVIFAGGTGLTPVLDQSYSFNGIGFASGAGLFVIGSSGPSLALVGGATNNSANVQSLNLPINLTGTSPTFNAASGNLVLSNTISGSGQLNAAGAGGVTLDGTVSYSGNTFIAAGGSLILGATGQWQDALGNPTYSAGTSNNGTFIYNSPLIQTNAGVISGPGNIIVNGPGALSLSGANSYTGNLTINGGTVYDPVVEAVGAPVVGGLGNPQSTNTTTINSGGSLILNAPGGNEFGYGAATPPNLFVVNTNGLLQVTSGNAVMGPITLNGGTLSINSANGPQYEPFGLQRITVGGTVPSAILCASGVAGPNNGINLTINAAAGSQMPFIVASTGSSGPDLVVSAVMANSANTQNAAGFVKGGSGAMEITATNIFTGPISVTNGTVILGGGGQLSSGAYAANIAISNGGTFAFGSSQSQTISGVISGAGTLLVSNTSGPGLVLSTAASTLTGPVVIKSGTLALIASASLGGSSGVSIAGGATFDLSLLASPYVWPAASSVIGSGTTANPATINSPGAVTLTNSAVVLNYDNTNAAPQPALNITGNLTLGGNAFTVNSADGLPLANGSYVVAQASGTITSTGNYPLVAGTAIGPTSKGAISVSGSQVLLTVSAIPTSQPTMSFSLSGKVLTFSWPPDHQGWILQSNSINLAVPGDW
ncbi:MAG: autotransporter-associated beta strand repeat-containing protein, partial [Verrucomicrobiota bacterium]